MKHREIDKRPYKDSDILYFYRIIVGGDKSCRFCWWEFFKLEDAVVYAIKYKIR